MGASGSVEEAPKASVQVTLEDLELPPRRDKPVAAAPVSQLLAAGGGAAAPSKPRICEELLPGAEPKGQRAFEDAEEDL